MRLTKTEFPEGTPIDSYGPGFFRIGGQVYHGPVIARPGAVLPWGGTEDTGPLLALAADIDVLFLGMGASIAHAPADLRCALDAAGVAVEVMSTPAAARTYNVLLSEGRRIAAALVPVGGQPPQAGKSNELM
ncbi:MAG: Mth938-like domain-containing protein [Rhodobacteraceae bacterium]|nr:Mth938-like domain-containing protein [Paracoccaceae bacterium]